MRQSRGKHKRAAPVSAIAKMAPQIRSTGNTDGSCACIVFVMKPPRPPVQALVDSRAVIFCDMLSEEIETKQSSLLNVGCESKVIHNSRFIRDRYSQELLERIG